jgi:agarase
MFLVHRSSSLILFLALAGYCFLVGGWRVHAAEEGKKPKTSPAEGVAPSPFIRIVQDRGGWAFEKDGAKFLSFGMNVIQAREENPREPEQAYDALSKYNGDLRAWSVGAITRLKGWGFNTAGAWATEELLEQPFPHTRVIYFANYDGTARDNRLIDVFADSYAKQVEETAQRDVAPHRENVWLLGYFINNELPWYGERSWPTAFEKSLLERYWMLPQGSPGRDKAVAFLKARYPNLEAFRDAWQTSAQTWNDLLKEPTLNGKGLAAERVKCQFAGVVADRYFSLCHDAIRKYDPNHLILGCRFAGMSPASVLQALARYSDVISFNLYQKSPQPNLAFFRNVHALTGRPVMLTEFSWRAAENRSGNSNTAGTDVTLPKQADRGRHYQEYVTKLLSEPFMVGAHWFQYFDQPSGGRIYDGEDSNYGIVDIRDEPYEELTSAMKTSHELLAKRRPVRNGRATYIFDPRTWGELLEPAIPSGDLPAPVDVFASAQDAASPVVKADWLRAANIAVERDQAGWAFNYTTGRGRGVHVLFPLRGLDLQGATAIELDITTSNSLRIQFFLDESGHNYPDTPVFVGADGADGESYEFSGLTALRGHQTIRLNLTDAQRRLHWGNPNGNATVDTQGLEALAFELPGAQGKGRITIHSIKFLPAGSPISSGTSPQ